MRWPVPLSLLAVLACAAPAAAATPVPASVSVRDCRTAAKATDRSVSFRSEMRAVPGTDRMAVRFDLEAQTPGSELFDRIVAPTLGDWISATPGVDIFRYTKQVTNLAAPAVYRARVSFRWTRADGKTVRRTVLRTATCRQPDPRANLRIDSLQTEDVVQRGLARYLVAVRNDGAAAAPAFDVGLVVDGVAQPPVTVAGLAPGARQTVSIVARDCRFRGSVRATVDSAGAVDEADETDNADSETCRTLG